FGHFVKKACVCAYLPFILHNLGIDLDILEVATSLSIFLSQKSHSNKLPVYKYTEKEQLTDTAKPSDSNNLHIYLKEEPCLLYYLYNETLIFSQANLRTLYL